MGTIVLLSGFAGEIRLQHLCYTLEYIRTPRWGNRMTNTPMDRARIIFAAYANHAHQPPHEATPL